MVLWILCGYLGFAALFYLGLTATASGPVKPAAAPRPKWQRVKRTTQAVLRRVRGNLTARGPRQPE